MADLARALQTPVPGQQPAAPPQPAPQTGEKTASDKIREAKNERDRLRRKAQRAAALKAAETSAPKKKKRKAKKKVAAAPAVPVTRGRGRPPGSKNKRGRPPGAKNKPTAFVTPLVLEALMSMPTAELVAFKPALAALAGMSDTSRRKAIATLVAIFK